MRNRRAVLVAIAAGSLAVLVAYFWLRPIREGASNGTERAIPLEGHETSKPPATPSAETAEQQEPRDSLVDSRSAPNAASAGSGVPGAEPRDSLQASASDDQLVDTSSATSGTRDGLRKSPVDCWKTNDPESQVFSVSLDHDARTKGNASASISPIRNTPQVGQLFQTVDARDLRGNRVQFTADLRTSGARRGAGLWIRANDARGHAVAMKQALLMGPESTTTGNVEWTTVSVMLDIPGEARVVSYGLTMGGIGRTWIDDARIEVTDSTITAIGTELGYNSSVPEPEDLTNKPANLDFELEAGAPCNDSRAPTDSSSRPAG